MTETMTDEGLTRLLAFITQSRGIDFNGYKRTSLVRRIHKRMADVGVGSFDDYCDLLETNSEEFRFLFDTILINVTSFFRDARSWEFLRAEVVPEIVEQAAGGEIRVWSAGCSSGEEACSLAITFAEALGLEGFCEQVKIYATDVDEDALRQARHGVYPAKALEPMSQALVSRYFEPTGASFSFHPEMRRRIIYGRHDLTRDAPISRLHLLTCRNTLMYFNAETQAQILDRFHYALVPEGVLFLGKAEMLLSDGERFESVSMTNRIFRRRRGPAGFRTLPAPVTLEVPESSGGKLRHRQLRDVALETAPLAHVVVDLNGTVVLANNQARAMFGMTTRDEGRLLRDLELSYRPVELRSLIEQAQTERRIVRLNGVERLLSPTDTQYLDVQVLPLLAEDGRVLGVDVVFADSTAFVRLYEDAKHAREDLETAYEELQSTNEELETTNEELQSSIEELETTNEELQSTNEELETTNEELQSSNEELATTNEELRARSGELDETRLFLEAVMSSLPLGVVVLDAALRVRSWSSGATDLWGLRRDEAENQAFFGLDLGLPVAVLRESVQECLESGGRHVLEVAAVNRLGRGFTCCVTMCPLTEARDGVVLVMEERT